MKAIQTIKVATRPSALAMAQTAQIVDSMQQRFPQYEFQLVPISTRGDSDTQTALRSFGGTGLFVKELEAALLDGRADIAVHSLKDVPSLQPEGLVLAAFPVREDPRDCLIVTKPEWLEDFPSTGLVGTGSPRRVAQMRGLLGHSLRFAEIRGNIDSRLAKLSEGQCDGLILAMAGLKRLGITPEHVHPFDPAQMIPAPGQGSLAIECREGDEYILQMLKSFDDLSTRTAVVAERAFMRQAEGGCKFPLAAYARTVGKSLHFSAMIGDIDGSRFHAIHEIYPAAEAEREAVLAADKLKLMCTEDGMRFV